MTTTTMPCKKMDLYFTLERVSQLSRSVPYAYRSEDLLKLIVKWEDAKRLSKIRTSFHAVLLQTMVKKCTKIQNARAEPLCCSLRPWQTRTHCCGHIVAHDVSWAAQTGKHLLRTQNVSEQNQKLFCVPDHSRPQSLRSLWPAAGKQQFQACAIDEG